MEFVEIGWRVLNVVLASIAFLALAAKTVQMWNVYTERMRLLAMALALFLVTTVEGTVEQILQDGDFGFRVAMTTVAVLWTLHALLRSGPGYTKEEPYHTPKYES